MKRTAIHLCIFPTLTNDPEVESKYKRAVFRYSFAVHVDRLHHLREAGVDLVKPHALLRQVRPDVLGADEDVLEVHPRALHDLREEGSGYALTAGCFESIFIAFRALW